MSEKVAGAHYGDSMVIYLAGLDPRKGNTPFLAVEPTPGGWGAFATNDGQDALINNVNGGFKDLPIEVYENKYPIMLKRYGIRTDTGGAGKFRGGNGLYREYHLEAPGYVYLWFERSKTPAWGLFGGQKAVGPDVVLNPGRKDERHVLKSNGLPVKAGSVVLSQTGGGGGFGRAWERDAERVREDVLNGYVSVEGAERDYGVVLTKDLMVDETATKKRRNQRKKRS
jgi:N-methylhydantoinase B